MAFGIWETWRQNKTKTRFMVYNLHGIAKAWKLTENKFYCSLCSTFYYISLHCLRWHCALLLFTAVPCITLYGKKLHLTRLHLTELNFTTFTALRLTALHYALQSETTVHWSALHFTRVYCTSLKSTWTLPTLTHSSEERPNKDNLVPVTMKLLLAWD